MSSGWAQVLNRLIHTSTKSKKEPLSRALKDGQKPKKEDQVEKDESVEEPEENQINIKTKSKLKSKRKKGGVQPASETIRKKPTFQDREYERSLQAIATKGVVQLFNAITSLEDEPPSKKPKEDDQEPMNKAISKWGELEEAEDEDEEEM